MGLVQFSLNCNTAIYLLSALEFNFYAISSMNRIKAEQGIIITA